MRKESNNRVRCLNYRVARYRNWPIGIARWIIPKWAKLGKICTELRIFLINPSILILCREVNSAQKHSFWLRLRVIPEEWVDSNLNNFWSRPISPNFSANPQWNQLWKNYSHPLHRSKTRRTPWYALTASDSSEGVNPTQ